MKEQIKKFLVDSGWTSDGDNFNRDVYIPGQQISINGQVMSQPGRNQTITIEYLGEGSFMNVGEEEEPIHGYHMGGEDIWVLNVDDFVDWYNRIYKK